MILFIKKNEKKDIIIKEKKSDYYLKNTFKLEIHKQKIKRIIYIKKKSGK